MKAINRRPGCSNRDTVGQLAGCVEKLVEMNRTLMLSMMDDKSPTTHGR